MQMEKLVNAYLFYCKNDGSDGFPNIAKPADNAESVDDAAPPRGFTLTAVDTFCNYFLLFSLNEIHIFLQFHLPVNSYKH